jgi:hypothetical protein
VNATLYPACAVVAWVVVLTNAKQLSAMWRQSARLATWVMFLCFALAFTSAWSVISDRIDGWTGLYRSSVMITQLLVVCFSASALVLLQLWASSPSQARLRIALTSSGALLVLVAMVTLFVLSEHQHVLDPTYAGWYGGSGTQGAYLELYLTVFTAADVSILVLCLRYGRLMTRSWLRTGLITTAVGATLGTVYSLTHLAGIISSRMGINPQRWENLAEVGAGGGALLVMIGLSMHTWGPWTQALVARVRRIAAFAQLYPLWTALCRRDPGIALDRPPRERRFRTLSLRVLRDPEYCLARRVVEIRDGILALHPYFDPAVTDRARDYYQQRRAGLRDPDIDAAIEALRIRTALDTSIVGPKPTTAAAEILLNHNPAELDAEAAWLARVAKHFTRCHHDLPTFTFHPAEPSGAEQ